MIETIFVLAVLILLLVFLVRPGSLRPQQEAPFRGRCYAHRGLYEPNGPVPENSLAAFRAAAAAGYGIELDVQLTKDGVPVIIHDEAIDRTSNHTGLVRDMRYEELCQADFAYKWQGTMPFQKIPTLREYFELVQDKDIITNIELKTGVFEYPGIEGKVLALIEEYGLFDRVVVSSFNHHSVLRIKALAPKLCCGFLSETWILDAGAYVSGHGIEAYHPHFAMLTDPEVADLKAHNVQINTWTVNEAEDIRHMIAIEADGIISNWPARVKEELVKAGLR